MKTKILNLIFAGLCISAVTITGCSKNESVNELNQNPQTLTARSGDLTAAQGDITNRNLVITYARDNGVDITAEFSEFTFNMQGTPPSGQAHVWNDLLAQTGTWNYTPGTDLITLKYPTEIFQELVFMNRTWHIGESSSTVFRLYSDDGDEVQLTGK
jgi:hypothetical protein